MTLPKEVREAIGEAVDNEMALQVERGPLSYAKVGDAALSALEAAGWKCVPVEMTHEMRKAGVIAFCDRKGRDAMASVWAAMLSASQEREDD